MPDYQPRPQRIDPQRSIPNLVSDDPGRKQVPRILELIKFGEPQDSLARAEAAALASGDLEKFAAQTAHRRAEATRGHLHYLLVGTIWITAVGMIATACVWFYHFITPDSWHFLPHERIEEMKTVLLAAIGFAQLKNYLNKHM